VQPFCFRYFAPQMRRIFMKTKIGGGRSPRRSPHASVPNWETNFGLILRRYLLAKIAFCETCERVGMESSHPWISN
jgi:hypothetical protein